MKIIIKYINSLKNNMNNYKNIKMKLYNKFLGITHKQKIILMQLRKNKLQQMISIL